MADRVTDRVMLGISDDAVDYLLNKGFNPKFGARPMRRTIEQEIEDPLSETILRGEFDAGAHIEVCVDDDHLVFRRKDNGMIDSEDTNEESGDSPDSEEAEAQLNKANSFFIKNKKPANVCSRVFCWRILRSFIKQTTHTCICDYPIIQVC